MSILLQMVSLNVPLHDIATFRAEAHQTRYVSLSALSGKKLATMVRTIVRALTSAAVVDQVAIEWDGLPPLVRMGISDECNSASRSGNHRKAVVSLDRKLNGRLLRSTAPATERVLISGGDGKAIAVQRRVNAARAAGERHRATLAARPADYDRWPPSKKRRWQAEQRGGA